MIRLECGKHFTSAANTLQLPATTVHLQYSVGDKAIHNDCFCWKLDTHCFRHSNPDFTQTFQKVRRLTPLLYQISTFLLQT